MSIEVGRRGRAETTVTEQNTAAAVGSGSLSVFATPMMTALMEQAACAALDGALEPGETTVGTRLEITHDAATPVGAAVWAEAEVTAVDRRKITFSVRAFDAAGPIGQGVHERFVVRSEPFVERAQARKGAESDVH